jgi:hypothetical protein
VIVGLLQGSPQVVPLQTQMVAIVEAIGDGRRSPRVYQPPRQTDYDLLAVDLGKLGWTKADLQLFSDERALAKAPPDKVCQLVHDWFAAQLAISDADVQQRLLVDSLRPVWPADRIETSARWCPNPELTDASVRCERGSWAHVVGFPACAFVSPESRHG